MADPFSSWGSSASASSGPFSSWGGNYHYGGGAPTTGHSLLSGLPGEHLIHQVESLPLNIVQGLYSTGKAAVVDVKNHPVSLLSGPLAPAVAQEVSFAEGGHGGELTTKVVEPTIHAYEQKYWSRDVLSHIVNDPLGTLLDAAALGTIPLGGEGVAIRAASLAEKVGVSGETLDRLNALADAARARRADVRIAYKPNEGPGQVFTAPRARTLQGRRVYNPIRERVGEAKGGTLPLVGNAARANRFFESERVAKMHLDLQDLRDAERSFQPTARARETGLTRAENVALPIAAEYGPKAAVRDALGAPRQQKIRFYTKELAKTKERLSGETSKGARSVLEAQARAQQRIISLLSGSDKFAKQIDEAIKNPRSNFTTALEDARRLVHGHEQAMIASGHAAPEFLEARRFLPQMLMHDMTWEDAKTIGYEQAPANYRSARAEYEAALKPPPELTGQQELHPTPGVTLGHAPAPVISETRPTFALRLPRLFYDKVKAEGHLEGHNFSFVSQTPDYVRVRMDEQAFRHLEQVANHLPQIPEVRSALRRIAQQRGVMEDAVDRATQKLAWKTDQTGMWHVPGSDYLVVPSDHAYTAYKGGERLGEYRTLPEAKRAVERDAARRRSDALQSERIAATTTEGGDPFMAEIDHPTLTPIEPARPVEAGIPDATIEAAWIARLQNAGDELRQARTRPGAKRAIIKEGGFYGGSKTLDEIKAEHEDAFYYPHLGPELKHEFPSAKTGNPRVPGETRRNKGRRFTSGQYAQGSQQWLRARVHWIKYESAQLVRQQALRIGEEYDGHNLLPGHVPFNIGMTPLSRGPREAGVLDEHFHNLTDEEHASATQQLMNEMFPAHVPGQKNATWQVPESFAKSVKGNYAEANPFVRKFIDRPIEVWKAVVLKYRPAWLVNNILGQHLLLLLHNAGGIQDYVRALSPENRQKLADALPGLLIGHGTATLVEKSRLEDLGFETTLRGRVKGGDIRHSEEGRGVGGIVGQVGYRAVSYPAKAVKGFGDGIARANLEVADNIPRTALTYRYLREYKAALQSAESANHAVTNLVKGKSLEQVAAEMPLQAKLEMTAKVNRFLGDFNTLTGKYGKMLRRVVPFASWFKVILEISKDLTFDHPEKLLLVWNLEQAAKHDPSSVPNFNIPSWFLGSVISPGFQTRKGEANLLSTNALNPFATPVQLADQLTVLLHSGAPSGTQSPIASLGPGAEAINLLQGFDPFYGGSYTGPGDKNSGLVRVALGITAGLPAVRLANEAGLPLTGKYHQPASYDDRFANVGGHSIPLDAILRYMGLPLRRANRAKLQEYARRGL